MLISDISIRRPVFTTMVMISLMTLGTLAFGNLGVDLFPDVSFPVVSVTTVYPGASPAEMERLVSREIEEAIASTNGVTKVHSYSRDSASIVVIEFSLDVDAKASAADVREKVAAIRSKLPDDVHEPLIQRFDMSAEPILTYVVGSPHGPVETRRLAEDLIKPRLEAVQGVGAVRVIGGLEREVQVRVDKHRLEAAGLTLAQVAQIVGAEGLDIPAGRVIPGRTELNVRTSGRYRSLDELRELVLASLGDGSQIRLRDVATVADAHREVRTLARLNGKDAVALEVRKQGGSNTVAVADGVYAAVEKLGRTLPAEVSIMKAIDGSTFIRQNVHDVAEAVIYGGLMAILVIFLFMLDWRSTVISALAIPTSVLTTFLVMWAWGFTFNIMSLLGLSLAIGLLIDDAVVVRENIYRHMELGKNPVRAAREATHEIGLAVMATTFAIVAVFVPVAFMGGIVGRMFTQFGITVAAAVLVSLFVSFTLDPMMSAQVMRPVRPGEGEEKRRHRVLGAVIRFYDRLDAGYRELLRWALGHRRTVVAAALALFLGSLGLTSVIGQEFLAQSDRGEFLLHLELPGDVSLREMDRATREAERRLRENPHVRQLYTTVGIGESAHRALIRVYTTSRQERYPLTQWQIQDDLRARLAGVPGLRFSLQDIGIVEAMSNEVPIALFIRGDDLHALQAVAEQALEVIRAVPGVKDPDTSFRPGKTEAAFRLDRNRAADLGVSVSVVAQSLRLALEGAVVSRFREGDRDWDVRVQLAEHDRGSVSDLSHLTVPATLRRLERASPLQMMAMSASPLPKLVHLAEVATLESESGPATIERMDRARQITLKAQISGRALGDIVRDIQAGLERIPRPEGVSFTFGGETELMEDTFDNMLIALFVAILFIFFVLASQFESLVHPLTIMLSLPLAIVGALVLLFVTGWGIGMSAMIGIILLMGLVTKNAILLVDYTNELRARGLPMVEALLEAGPTRLRPILMTSLSTVLGMLPIALARGPGFEFRAPMAIAVIGGVLVSTLLTLVVVPVVYTWMDRFSSRGRRMEETLAAGGELHDETGRSARLPTGGAS